MKILFLSDNFPPEVNAPASRTFEHCREWVRSGHDVTVITCAPNFPCGKVFTGYRNWPWQRETVDGIRVIRVWSYIAANEGFLRRILDYLSFMFSATVAGMFVSRPNVIVGTSPQFFTACAAWALSRLRRRPYVFELRDLWPESIKAVGAMGDSRFLTAMARLELFLYRNAAAVVSVTESFKHNLVSRGIVATKIEVVTNGVDLDRFSPRPRDQALARKLGLEGKFVAGYVGTHGMAHGLETILDAAEKVKYWPDGKRYAFVLLGDGARKKQLVEDAASRNLDNVLFIDSVPKESVARYWSLLDVSVIHLRKAKLFESVIPSKLFECMGMGIPVLHGVAGESASIVRREGVGICFESGNADDLLRALGEISRDGELMQRCRQACAIAASRYTRRELAAKMLGILSGASGA